jgi:hypothetical protein
MILTSSATGRTLFKLILTLAVILVVVPSPKAWGAESGTGVYILGYQSSMAGYLPAPGLYLRNDFYLYQGKADLLAFSGRIEAQLTARSILNLVNLTYVTPYKILGANYALGVMWGSIGNTSLKARVDILQRFNMTREEDYTGIADLAVSPIILGWHLDQFHIMAMGNFYAPTGAYNVNRRVNTGLNRWALEPNVAVTWLHPKRGYEVSLAAGYTVNFKNPDTDYLTGNEFHLEFFLGQHLPKGFVLGMAGYFYRQVTGDSGRGALLGGFQGRTFALGPCLSYNGKIGRHDIGLNARYYNELDVKHRFDGQSFFFTFSFGF